MKGRMHHLQLFSCPSPPTICCCAIEVSQYILPLVPVPFEETTNAAAFRGYTVALFIVPRLTAPSYLCPLLQALFVTGARGCKKDEKRAGKLFIVRTGASRSTVRRRAAPFTQWHLLRYPSRRQTCNHEATAPKSVCHHRWNCFQWKSGDGRGGGCVLHPVSAEVVRGCPITGWDKIRGQFNYASVKREGDYIFFRSESLSTPVWPFMLELLAVWPLLEVILMTTRSDNNRGALSKSGPPRLPQQMFYKDMQRGEPPIS